jgi:hypothetical protein
MQVDLLKVPQNPDGADLAMLFGPVTADHYVMPGNGEDGNPDREVLEALIAARGDAEYAIHLSYPIDEIDQGRKAHWEKEQEQEQRRRTRIPTQQVRPDWSPRQHGLRAFCDARPGSTRR